MFVGLCEGERSYAFVLCQVAAEIELAEASEQQSEDAATPEAPTAADVSSETVPLGKADSRPGEAILAEGLIPPDPGLKHSASTFAGSNAVADASVSSSTQAVADAAADNAVQTADAAAGSAEGSSQEASNTAFDPNSTAALIQVSTA